MVAFHSHLLHVFSRFGLRILLPPPTYCGTDSNMPRSPSFHSLCAHGTRGQGFYRGLVREEDQCPEPFTSHLQKLQMKYQTSLFLNTLQPPTTGGFSAPSPPASPPVHPVLSCLAGVSHVLCTLFPANAPSPDVPFNLTEFSRVTLTRSHFFLRGTLLYVLR